MTDEEKAVSRMVGAFDNLILTGESYLFQNAEEIELAKLVDLRSS